MAFVVGFIVIFVLWRLYKKGNLLKQENMKWNDELEKLKNERKKQYGANRTVIDDLNLNKIEFDELAKKYLTLKDAVLKFEKNYHREIQKKQWHYDQEYNFYKKIRKWRNEQDKRKGILKRLPVPREKYPARDIIKALNCGLPKSMVKVENVDQEFAYEKARSLALIVLETLGKWAVVLAIVCAVFVVLAGNPQILLMLLVFLISFALCFWIGDKLGIDQLLVIPIIVGIVTIGYFIVALFMSLGAIVYSFVVVYFTFGIAGGLCHGFWRYNEELKLEGEKIQGLQVVAHRAINEWNNIDLESDLDSLEPVIDNIEGNLNFIAKIMNQVTDSKRKSEIDLKKCIEAYWDYVFFGNVFIKGLNGNNGELNVDFAKVCSEKIRELNEADWRRG